MTIRRSEEHTSELQSRLHLVCRLLLEKKESCRGTTLAMHHATKGHYCMVGVRWVAGPSVVPRGAGYPLLLLVQAGFFFFFLMGSAPPDPHLFPHPLAPPL